ncbi:UNVERIFIED_CONTAM: hypothetical protein FKN15_024872 [Acipenser sinensis]
MFLLEVSYFMVLSTAFTSIISVLLLLAVSRQLWAFRWRMTRDRTCKLPLPNGSMGWPLFGETFHWLLQVSYFMVLSTAFTSIISVLLLLAVSRQLWAFRWRMTRDRTCKLPLPNGSMGWPLFGETFHWLLQGSSFHISRREKYGNVFRTHVLGKPVIRVTGAENIRKILLGEHNLVSTQWPQSTRIILGANTLVNSIGDLHKQKRKVLAKVFSHAALETYIPRIQGVVRTEVERWCANRGSINVYPSAKALTFRIAVRVLLGLSVEDDHLDYLSKTFEQLMENLFSLPLDVPFSGLRKVLAKVFSHAALETYIPRIQGVVRTEVESWCVNRGSINVYPSAKALTFRIAVRVLLGLSVEDDHLDYLSKTFEQLMENLFSLPLDVPFSGLRKGIKARDTLHECMEKIIAEKLQQSQSEEYSDALDYMLSSAKENGNELNIKELKESAVELIFAAYSTTASASTSLILQLTRHPSVAEKAKQELVSQGLNGHRAHFKSCEDGNSLPTVIIPEASAEKRGTHEESNSTTKTKPQKGFELTTHTTSGPPCTMPATVEEGHYSCHQPYLSLEKLSQLHYLDCVVKEVLRTLPPVSGGYRTALQTFELDGYQIPKGWSVMYSIRDTHETAAVYQSPELFDPDRFGTEREEGKAGRFNFIPFGGGIRSCIGRKLAQRRKFLQIKRQKYGFIYKTHLFGSPTVRVMGAENVRQILMGEHKLVAVQWPASVRTILGSGSLSNLHDSQHKNRKKVIMKAFSTDSLQHYIPVIEEEVRSAVSEWLENGSCVLVYPELKRLMFRIAMRILLGFEPEQTKRDEHELVDAFEEMIRNLFSLPIDVPFSGLYRGLKARNFIHSKIEENIRAKISKPHEESQYKDALQLLIENCQKNGEPLSMQELKESATELLFGGHETTASAATSLVMFLGLHQEVVENVRKELHTKGILGSNSQDKQMDIEMLGQLKYMGCVIKETLRISPPVPGAFRVALKTFELNGYQIPKGWNVIYSICDTHDVADIFPDKEDFNPERFMTSFPEDSSRFNYIPFGGGSRSCVGKEFAKILLKIFLVELTKKCNWTLLNGPPTMKTGPTVYPVDNLPTKFSSFIDNFN